MSDWHIMQHVIIPHCERDQALYHTCSNFGQNHDIFTALSHISDLPLISPIFLPFPTHLHFSFIPISFDQVHCSGNCQNRKLPKVSQPWDAQFWGFTGANVCLHQRLATPTPSISGDLLSSSVKYPCVGYCWKATDEESPILMAEAYNLAIQERCNGLYGIFSCFQYINICFISFLCHNFTVICHSFCPLAGQRPIFISSGFYRLF